MELQLTQGKLDALQQELSAAHLNEKVMDNKPKATIRTRRETRSETKVEQVTTVGGSIEGVINVDKETIDLP